MNYERIGFLALRWSDHTRGYEARAAQTHAFAQLCNQYRAAGRFYHNLSHVAAVLDVIEGLCDEIGTQEREALRFAGWYHDVVYDTRASDNEERSAEFAAQALATFGVPDATINEVRRLIELTKAHQTDASDVIGCILLDADLAILGVPDVAYDRYASAIRREYAQYDDPTFRTGRRGVLERFLMRPQLFKTQVMVKRYEAQARRNIAREIARLGE